MSKHLVYSLLWGVCVCVVSGVVCVDVSVWMCRGMCMHVCGVLVLVCIYDREEQGSKNGFLPPLCWDCRCVPLCMAFYMGAGDRNSVLMSHHHILKFLSKWLFLCLCMCFCVHCGFFSVTCTFRKYPSLYPAFSLLSLHVSCLLSSSSPLTVIFLSISKFFFSTLLSIPHCFLKCSPRSHHESS